MKRSPFLLLLLAASLASWATPRAQKPRKPLTEAREDIPKGAASLRVSIDEVRVDVTVRDKKGNLITGLQKGNFKVYEDKVEQKITYFAPVDAPMTAVLVTEYSRAIPWEWLNEAWLASHLFVQQMRPNDWVAVVAYDMRPEILVDFTQNKAEVAQALRRLNFPAFRESNMYDALYDVLDRVEEVDGKVAVILVASGLDTFSKKNLDEVMRKVKSTNAVIYAISLGGHMRARAEQYFSTTLRMDLYQADAALRAFAKHTGGMAFFPRFVQQYGSIFETISLMLRNQYSLGYVSTNTAKDGKFHKIRVQVLADVNRDGKPDKLKVNHRDGYLAKKS